MISIIYADIGTGKSCLLSYIAYRAVNGKSINFRGLQFGTQKSYDYVYTNFPAFGCYKLDYDKIGEEDTSRSLLLLDECQLEADARNFKDFSDSKKMFFSLHRHQLCDIVVCSQEASMIDKRIRSLAARQYELTSGLFNFMRIHTLVKARNIKTQECEFEYASSFAKRIFRPRLYKYTDTHYMYDIQFSPRRLVPWFPDTASDK